MGYVTAIHACKAAVSKVRPYVDSGYSRCRRYIAQLASRLSASSSQVFVARNLANQFLSDLARGHP